MKEMNVPVGVSDFEEIRKNGYYYIDKSGLIGELLSNTGTEATVITRPRRFGKTLGMSMLESFFDIRKDSRKLFDGLEIAENQALCDAWMNRYPTAFVSFRQVDGLDFTGAYGMLTMVIADLYNKHLYLLDSKTATEFQKTAFEHLAHGNGSEKEVKNSLMLLTTMMQQHYGKPVILLIDEYDVPVAKANNNGYYNEMLDVMKGLMQALKDNQALQFAVVTGCLKIAKESIFTGTNNFVSDTITNSRLSEYFGFVQSEVDQLLKDADLTEQADNIKKWYDGYHFGDFDVYCPWDVMNYMLELQRDPKAKPISYWKNTSDNAIIRSFIDYAGSTITNKLETLMAGGCIVQRVDENLTYNYLHIRDTAKVLIILSISFLLVAAEDALTTAITFSALIAIMFIGIGLQKKRAVVAKRLSVKYGKLWVAAEVFLFVLVGATVNIGYLGKVGAKALLLIVGTLAFRMLGVFVCLLGTSLSKKERLFAIMAYTPKATVQAAIGGIPLALGFACGDTVLTVAVLAIVLTAPLGAFAMDLSYKKLLKKG